MARMEDILAVSEQSISERLLTNFLKSAAYTMIDLKRILDRTETAEPKYMLRGEKNGSVVKIIWEILVYINQTSFFSKSLLKIWTSLMCFLNLQDGNSTGLPSRSPIMWVGQLLL